MEALHLLNSVHTYTLLDVFNFVLPPFRCRNVGATWYLGNDCRLPILMTAFYIGLSVTLACLMVTVGALTAYVLINKQKQTR